jgi:hypothetical protein
VKVKVVTNEFVPEDQIFVADPAAATRFGRDYLGAAMGSILDILDKPERWIIVKTEERKEEVEKLLRHVSTVELVT